MAEISIAPEVSRVSEVDREETSPYKGRLLADLARLRKRNHQGTEELMRDSERLPFANALKKVHRTVFNGASEVGLDEERWPVGNWRRNEVKCGEYFPPESGDVGELIEAGQLMFEDLKNDKRFKSDPKYVNRVASMECLYALMVHPFFDGNGETAKKIWSLTRIEAGSKRTRLPSSEEYKAWLNGLLKEKGLAKFIDMVSGITVDVTSARLSEEVTKIAQAKAFIKKITDHPGEVEQYAKGGKRFLRRKKKVMSNSPEGDLISFFQASQVIARVFDQVSRR